MAALPTHPIGPPHRPTDSTQLIVCTENLTTTHSNPWLTARSHEQPPASPWLGHASLASASPPSEHSLRGHTRRGAAVTGERCMRIPPVGGWVGRREGRRAGTPRSVYSSRGAAAASLQRGVRAVGEQTDPSSPPEKEIGKLERSRAYWPAEYLTSPGKMQARYNLHTTRLNLLYGYRECKVTQTAHPMPHQAG